MSDITLTPLTAPFLATMSPPGSKSLTNRAMILGALADGACTLRNVLFADDTRVMIEALRALGFAMEVDERQRVVRIEGQAGRVPATAADLLCGNSGTSIRFLTALCALGHGTYTLDGIARMRQRPIGQLVDMLHNLGVRIEYPQGVGFPPVRILADGLPGGLLRFGASQSSQYLSAVLQAAPYAKHEVQVTLEGRQTSWPYVAMTMRLMDVFGHTPHLVRDEDGEPRKIIIPAGAYLATDYTIEPDASNATYFLALAALHPGSRVTLEGLGRDSLQGDVGFAHLLKEMGADVTMENSRIIVTGPQRLTGIDADFLAMPDTAQTMAVVALFAKGPSTLRGLHTLKLKETDRIAALVTELTKLGADVHTIDGMLTITPPAKITPAAIDTYDDHRMAMSFALAGTRAAGVTINDAQCVNKTYPEYFNDLARVTAAKE